MQVNRTFTGLNLADGLRRWSLVLAIIAGVAGCNNDGGSGGSTATSSTVTSSTAISSIATDVVLSGSVGDGPSTVKARGKDYPLRLVVSGGIDLVTGLAPDFKMVSLLQSPPGKQANINPFTTFIVALAESLPGGLNSTNVSTAQGIVLDRLGFGLDPTLVPDPFTTQIDAGNVASLVKASEALGELVRRTRDLTGTGANRVVAALSADLSDGYLDGLGATGTDARLAAVANVAASQVLVETLSNTLRVGGVIASGVMDQSIRSVRPGISNAQLTGSVLVTAQLLSQARLAVAAAQVLDGGATVQDIADRIDGLTANSTAAAVSRDLPADSTNALRTAVLLVPGSSATEISAINQLVFAYSDATGSIPSTSTTTSATTSTTSTTGSTSTTGTTSTTTSTTGTTGTTTAVVGSFTLNWTAPTTRSDGTPLSLADIGGYRVYYGTVPGSYPDQVTVNSGTAQSATIGNLAAGTDYYLVMTTLDNAGLESGYSPEVRKTAQ
jgi:hypothetical protein